MFLIYVITSNRIDKPKLERLKFMTNSNLNFDGANEEQKEAILHTEGPVLITAGSGTGKTKTMFTRVMYLLEEKGVGPEEILISTRTYYVSVESNCRPQSYG